MTTKKVLKIINLLSAAIDCEFSCHKHHHKTILICSVLCCKLSVCKCSYLRCQLSILMTPLLLWYLKTLTGTWWGGNILKSSFTVGRWLRTHLLPKRSNQSEGRVLHQLQFKLVKGRGQVPLFYFENVVFAENLWYNLSLLQLKPMQGSTS